MALVARIRAIDVPRGIRAPETLVHTARMTAMRKLKEEIAKKEGLEKSSDAYIEALIYHSMGKSDATWNAISEVTKGLKNLRYQKDKFQALKDNIQVWYRGYGWEHWKTPWSSGGRKLTIPDLTLLLKDLIKGEKS